jgi:hypothetical protein
MPAPLYDTAKFISDVRRDCFLAVADTNWTDPRILGIADDALVSLIAPVVKRTKQEWYATDYALTLVANQADYDVPQEAMYNGIEAAWLRYTSDNRLAGKLLSIQGSERGAYDNVMTGSVTTPTAFYFRNTQIRFTPPPDGTAATEYNVLLGYYRRPAQLVLPTDTCIATAIDSPSLTVTTSSQPTYFTTNGPDVYTSGSPYRVDVYARNTPNTRKLENLTCTAPSLTTLTFNGSVTAAQVALIDPGDIITVRGTTCFPDIPADAHPTLKTLVCEAITKAQTDRAAYEMTVKTSLERLQAMLLGMSNRADGSPKKLSLANAPVMYTSGVWRRWW